MEHPETLSAERGGGSLERMVRAMSDEELFYEIRVQVNKARNQAHGHDRAMTLAVGAEMVRRGWRNSPNDSSAADREPCASQQHR